MTRLHYLLLFFLILIVSCKNKEINNEIISQTINTLNMNIFSKEGNKLFSIKSPYSRYDSRINTFNLNETRIELFDDNQSQYIITSDESKLSNNNKLLELNGNVNVKTVIKNEDKLYSNSFTWNIDNNEFLLIGNVRFENNTIILTSNKAILNKTNNIIEFFSPVRYKVNDRNNKSSYEVNSENAYYNIKTKSVSFKSNKE